MIEANILSITTTNKDAINNVYNVACGDRNTLNDLMNYIKEYLHEFDPKISKDNYGPNRVGDIHILTQVLIKQNYWLQPHFHFNQV